MLRNFTDVQGTAWRVWTVNARLNDVQPGNKLPEPTRPLGWLCFESDSERRRLSPVPDGWESCEDSALATLCSQATVVPSLAQRLNVRLSNA